MDSVKAMLLLGKCNTVLEMARSESYTAQVPVRLITNWECINSGMDFWNEALIIGNEATCET